MVKLSDEADEIVREHLDYVATKLGWEWTALVAIRPGTLVCRDRVNRPFVEKQYRKAYASLPKPMSMPSGFGKGRAA